MVSYSAGVFVKYSRECSSRGRGAYRSGTGGGQRSPGKQMGSMGQAYAQLGLESGATDAEVKKAYRKLVSEYHPDKIISKGLPEDFIKFAEEKFREINEAYEAIKKAKG